MLFRFSISKANGVLLVYDENYDCQFLALQHVKRLFFRKCFVKSITLHRHLNEDLCGPIEFVGSFILEGTQVINRETMEVL